MKREDMQSDSAGESGELIVRTAFQMGKLPHSLMRFGYSTKGTDLDQRSSLAFLKSATCFKNSLRVMRGLEDEVAAPTC